MIQTTIQSFPITLTVQDQAPITITVSGVSMGGGGGGAVDSVNGYTGVVVLDKTDIGLANVDNTSDLNKPVSTAVSALVTPISKHLANVMSTGLITGGDLSINVDPTKFDITAGSGIIIDNYTDPENPILTVVSWPAQSALVDPLRTTDATSYFYADSTGAFHFKNDLLSDSERRQFISIGWIDHPGLTDIEQVKVQPNSVTDVAAQLNDFMLALGPFNISGNEYTANTGLTIKRSAGKTFDSNANYWASHMSPNVVVTNAQLPVSFYYYYRDGSGGWNNGTVENTNIDPNNWDNGSGVLQLVPLGKWTIQIISFYSQTEENDIQYGQVVYDSLAEAQSALQSAIDINPYNAFDTFRAWAIVKQGATDLTDPAQAIFQSAGKLGMTSVQSGGGTGGEVNTASNIGTAGVGIFNSKLGVDLQFNNIEAGDNVTATYNSTRKTVVISSDQPCHSVGVVDITEPTFTDNGDGTGTFGACNVALFDNPNNAGLIKTYAVASATLSFVDGSQEYAAIKYNGGSPIWYKETDSANLNASNVSLIYVIWRQGSILHSIDQDSAGLGLQNKLNKRILDTSPYAISTNGGMIIAEVGSPLNRTITCTPAVVYAGAHALSVLSFDSSTDLLTKAVRTAGGWTYYNGTQYDNHNINPGSSGEVAIGNNKWAFRLFYRSIGDVKQMFYVESDADYNSLELARIASESGSSDLPPLLTGHCILVGRAMIQKDAASGTTEPFVRNQGAFISGITSHNDLAGLQGGQVNEYYHLTANQLARVNPRTATSMLDFGAFPGSTTASVTITGQTTMEASDIPLLTVLGRANGTHTDEEARYVASLVMLSISPPAAGDGFTIYGNSTEKIQGQIEVSWRY